MPIPLLYVESLGNLLLTTNKLVEVLPAFIMSRICALTGKKPKTGNSRSFSNKSSKRTFVPNLQKLRVNVGGRKITLKVSAQAIRTLSKDARGLKKNK